MPTDTADKTKESDDNGLQPIQSGSNLDNDRFERLFEKLDNLQSEVSRISDHQVRSDEQLENFKGAFELNRHAATSGSGNTDCS